MDEKLLATMASEIRTRLKKMASEIILLIPKEIDQEGRQSIEKIKENSTQIWEKTGEILRMGGVDESTLALPLYEQAAEVIPARNVLKILLVEDDVHILELLYRSLCRQYPDADIKIAENGVDACTTLGGFVPDLVLTDLMMPDVNGVSVVRHMKENERYKSTRVIIVTALNDWEESVQEVKSLGVEHVVQKPFSIKALLKTIDSTLNCSEQH